MLIVGTYVGKKVASAQNVPFLIELAIVAREHNLVKMEIVRKRQLKRWVIFQEYTTTGINVFVKLMVFLFSGFNNFIFFFR